MSSEYGALRDEHETLIHGEGFSEGYIEGWKDGAEANRKYIMGESNKNPLSREVIENLAP